MEESTGMDIDVIEGKNVPMATERGSEIDIKVRETAPEMKHNDVDFTGRPITDYPLLYKYENVRKLIWRNLSDNDLKTLFVGYINDSVQHLDVSRDICDLTHLVEIQPLQYVSTNLTYLNISGSIYLTSSGLKHLLKSIPHITELDISCTGLSSESRLISFQKVPALTSLNMSRNYLDDRSVNQVFRRWWRQESTSRMGQVFENLERLDISQNKFTQKGIEAFVQLRLLWRQEEEDVKEELPPKLQYFKILPQRGQFIPPQLQEELTRALTRPTLQTVKIVTIGTVEELDNVVKNYPNIEKIIIRFAYEIFRTTGANRYGLFDFRKLLYFKHLQHIEYTSNGVMPVNKTIDFLAKHPVCQTLEIHEVSFRDHISLAHVIRKNKVLKHVGFYSCDLKLEFVKLLLENTLLKTMSIEGYEEYSPQDIIPLILQNKTLLHFSVTNSLDKKSQFGWKHQKQIQAHLDENKQRLQVANQVIPLLAAVQHGGALRHSAIDLIPQIFQFMGQQPPSRDELKKTSQQIEPQLKLGRRKRQQQPLPYMFTPLHVPSVENEPETSVLKMQLS